MIRKSWEIHLVILTFVAAFLAGVAADANAQDVRPELERVYRSWISANVNKNFSAWKRHTAAHRYASTRNMVVSRKDKWPDVIFTLPFSAPDIVTLRHLATLQDGPTAHLIYFGKIDFGIDLEEGQEVPENILMLRFVKEGLYWKFDNTRFFNLGKDEGLLRMARIGDSDLLADDRFRPNGIVPEAPALIGPPDYAGDIWVASIGYEVEIKIGEHHRTIIGNNVITEMVMGGLSRAGHEIEVEIREIEIPEDVERRLEIEIYALRQPKPAARVWAWKPDEEFDLTKGYKSKVWANAVTIPGG